MGFGLTYLSLIFCLPKLDFDGSQFLLSLSPVCTVVYFKIEFDRKRVLKRVIAKMAELSFEMPNTFWVVDKSRDLLKGQGHFL